jgi:hypothetical protein
MRCSFICQKAVHRHALVLDRHDIRAGRGVEDVDEVISRRAPSGGQPVRVVAAGHLAAIVPVGREVQVRAVLVDHGALFTDCFPLSRAARGKATRPAAGAVYIPRIDRMRLAW